MADAILTTVGRGASWLWVLLLAVIVVNVVLRYVFGEGRIEFEELQWHLNALAFMLAIAYAYRTDSHIRIDLLSSRLTPRRQAWIELYGTLLLLAPFVVVVIWFAVPFVTASFALSEISASPGGLPFRWLVKAVLPIAFLFLLVAMASRLTRLWAFLSSGESAPVPAEATPTATANDA